MMDRAHRPSDPDRLASELDLAAGLALLLGFGLGLLGLSFAELPSGVDRSVGG
jgi:hypothetical protein